MKIVEIVSPVKQSCVTLVASHTHGTGRRVPDHFRQAFWDLREYARIAISRKRHFRSPKQKNEKTLQFQVPPKTRENSPQKPLLSTKTPRSNYVIYG